jgi:hypothetical protein
VSTIAPAIHLGHGGPQPIIEKCIGEGNITGIKVSRLYKILHLLFVDDVIIMTRATLKNGGKLTKLFVYFVKLRG